LQENNRILELLPTEFFIKSNSRILDLFFWLFWGFEAGKMVFWLNGVENG